MLTRVKTATLMGIKGYCVTVETDIHRGLPALNVTGLADTTIKEALVRIGPALINSGFVFPREKVTINLMPAGRPKEGSHFDLPMAMGLVMSWIGKGLDENTAFFGELSLDGRVNAVRGALPLAISARDAGIKKIVLPGANAEEISILEDIEVIPVNDLKMAVCYAAEGKLPDVSFLYKRKEKREDAENRKYVSDRMDFSQVKGQESAKRALTVAAAGGHGILMIGGAGCGKSMMAKRIPTILPELTYEEKLEITGIYSVANLLSEDNPVVEKRPFRAPHHSITAKGLTGGGLKPRPGELSLAHRGVLFLDELGEFDIRTIDAMRQPVEDGYIRLNRNFEEVVFPSDVMIVAAANPCKCGNLWDEKKICTCSERQINSYRRKLTGPFSDRIDMHIKIAPVPREKIEEKESGKSRGMSSSQMKSKVQEARMRQAERYRDMSFSCNGRLDDMGVRKFCAMTDGASRLLAEAYDRFGFSARAYVKILKTARTIADIEGKDCIGEDEAAEALMYRTGGWI